MFSSQQPNALQSVFSLFYFPFTVPYAALFLPLSFFSAVLHFSMLWTMQYNFHCTLTFSWPLNVNRFIPLQYVILANTGSTIPNRFEYNLLYFGVSIFSRIFWQRFSSYFNTGIYNVRIFFCFFLVRRHLSTNGQSQVLRYNRYCTRGRIY